MKITGMKGTMVMPLTLHVEEGSCRVLPGAAPCPALVLPGIGWLHGGEPQHPALNHGLWWQCTCRDTGCHHPCLLRPPTRSRCPPRPQRAPTEPLKAGLGAAGAHAAELGRLPRCHAQLGRLHGGGGGAGGASCSETGGLGLARPPWCCPQAVGSGVAWHSQQQGARGALACGGWGACRPSGTLPW